MNLLKTWWSVWSDIWGIAITIFIITLLYAVLLCILKYRKKRIFTPNKVLFIGTFISASLFFYPIYSYEYQQLPAILNSLQNAFRLFALDGDYNSIISGFENYPAGIKPLYTFFGSVLGVFAPILTFGFILSFFKDLSAQLKYSFCFWARTHVFSELNEKTLSLAKNLLKEKRNKKFLIFPKSLIVFTDIVDKKEELSIELIEDAKELGAILFRKDLESVRFKRHFPFSFRKVYFYLISEDESEKIRHAESIIKHYDYKKVSLKVFSDDVRTELLLAAKPVKNMRLSRINDIQALIYHNLYENGVNLFKRARVINREEDKDGNVINEERLISVIIVGLGKYGCEMLKALTWFCQFTNHKLKINVFDTDENASEKFRNMCPELMSKEYNNNDSEGEPHYEIIIHSGIDVSVPAFERKLKTIDDATYIFVCLGDDAINLDTATKIRAICERIEYKYEDCNGVCNKPDIETIIYDSTLRKSMGITWNDIIGIPETPEKEGFAEKLVKPIKAIFKKVSELSLKILKLSHNPPEEKPSGLLNYKGEAYNILISGDLENFYASKTVIDSRLVKEGFAMHVAYNLIESKFEFAEAKTTEADWVAFLKEQNLYDSWRRYHNSIRLERQNFDIDYNEIKPGFSYYTLAEMDEFEKVESNDSLTAEEKKELKAELEETLKLPVLRRINEWHRVVYAKFNACMQDKEFAHAWKKELKSIIATSEKSFRFEYNYRSSITKAIHRQLLLNYNFKKIPVDKKWEDMSFDDKLEVAYIEHIRWNAYMRTEGYCHTTEKRNDLAKRHPLLIPVTGLSLKDLSKDAYGCPEDLDKPGLFSKLFKKSSERN